MFRSINQWQQEARETATVSSIHGRLVISPSLWMEFVSNSSPESAAHYQSFSMKRGTLYELSTFISYIETFMVKPFI